MTSSAASFPRERHAGVLLPLFSAASDEGWGIGEIPDLVTLAAWHRRAGLDFLLMLPVNELAPSGHHSPYATVSAMAIDPIYLRLADVPEFAAAGGVERLSAEQRDRLAAVRQSAQVDYDAVREVKEAALRVAFDRFEHGRGAGTCRARRRFRQLRAARGRLARGLRPVPRAPRSLRVAAVVGVARRPEHAPAVGAGRRPAKPEARNPLPRLPAVARRHAVAGGAGGGGIRFFGDLPFVVGADSADVWQHQEKFDRELSVGTPPDAFSAEGQDWGLPAYRWDLVERDDFAWLRARARRGTELFDGYRVDHVIGFYRTYVRDAAGVGRFTPEDPEAQKALGRKIMQVFQASGGRHPRRGPGHRPRLPPRSR